MFDRLRKELTESQQQAVFHVEGPLLVLAGPGSGKTRVITYRIAALIEAGVAPWNICAITFTNKAAEEMRQRAMLLGASGGAHISTFHSLCVGVLRRYAEAAGIDRNFSIYSEADQKRCMKQAVKDCEIEVSNFPPARMLAAVSTLKNQLIDAETYATEAQDFFSEKLAAVYSRYQTILRQCEAMDFDDLLTETAFLLQREPDIAGELGDRFRYLLVDEYQDTNYAQYQIARLLASGHANIGVTGDPDQSIYRWRGADIRNILAFEKDWPDATVVKLEENFRSVPSILTLADKLIAFNQHRKAKRLVAVKEATGELSTTAYEDAESEARGVADTIGEMKDAGRSLNSVAVFYRVNSMSRALEEAFIRKGIPYQVVRGVEFYNRKEIRDVLAYLKLVANPRDEMSLLRIINTPTRGIGKVTIDRVVNYADRNRVSVYEALKKAEHITSVSKSAKGRLLAFANMIESFRVAAAGEVAPLIRRIVDDSGMVRSLEATGSEGANALENIDELIDAATTYDQQAEEPGLVDYLQKVSLFSDADAYDAGSDCVALMTLHAAKGLEFEDVFIIGLEQGLLPHERSLDQVERDEMEEERRLLFVGITRAKTNLHLSCARYRTIRGQTTRTVPSQFLFELGLNPERIEEDQCDDLWRDDVESIEESVATEPEFAAGDLVRHKTFGLGRVKQYVNMGPKSIVTVVFNAGGEKSLLVEYAGLTRM